jgi:superfamily II DNA or RNA helicase
VQEGLDALFDALREACPTRNWSRGIELARADAVDGVEQDADSATLRVKAPGRRVAPVVTLYLADEEWVCDCDSRAAACEHAAAAVIALRQARREGKALPTSAKAGARVGYRLRVEDERLAIDRVAVAAGKEKPLEGSLGGYLSGRIAGPAIEPGEVDLAIDRLITMKRLRSYAADALPPLFTLLEKVEDITLAGEPVRVSAEPLAPRVAVIDRDRGFALRFEVPEGFEAMVARGIAKVRGEGRPVLRLLDMVEVSGTTLEDLPSEARYGHERIAELVTRVLPELRKRTEVEVRTTRLPDRIERLGPRVVIEVEQRGAALSLLPVLVYGDPACARVDGDELVHLGGPLPKRDRRAEGRLVAELTERFDLPLARRADFTGLEAVAVARRLREAESDFAIEGEAHRVLYPEALDHELVLDPRAFALRFGAGMHEARPEDVFRAWREGGAVPLLGGGWAPPPAELLARYGERLADLLAARDAAGAIAMHAAPVLVELCRELEAPPPPELDRLRPLVEGFEGLPSAALPADLRAELRPYQRQGVDWLAFLRDAGLGAVLADDMGLGKTLQTLATLRGRALVVCPRSVVYNWIDEIERFRPGLRHHLYHGAERRLDAGADVTLTTYAILRNDVEILTGERWDAVVLDESQAIKNPDSQVARAAHRLHADFRVTLSGTPVENRLEELWSQMHFANRGLLGGRQAFRERYERPIAEGLPGAAAHLRDRIKPFVLRRMKKNVARELPPRSDMIDHCELDEAEREVYEAVRAATQADVLRELDKGKGMMGALEALLRLRQAACDAALVPGQGHLAEHEGRPRASSKVRRLLAELDEAAADGHKALVFSQWTSLLDRVEPQLERHGLSYCRLDGSTRDRASVVRRFQSDDGPPVMLISLKAGGTGLNLTAADHVFLLDPWWNPAVEDQAADRAHRIGQERPVLVHRMVAKDTLEERILALQEDKRRLAEAALGDAERAVGLTRDDLLSLLS